MTTKQNPTLNVSGEAKQAFRCGKCMVRHAGLAQPAYIVGKAASALHRDQGPCIGSGQGIATQGTAPVKTILTHCRADMHPRANI
jgi:hypothetical protein